MGYVSKVNKLLRYGLIGFLESFVFYSREALIIPGFFGRSR